MYLNLKKVEYKDDIIEIPSQCIVKKSIITEIFTTFDKEELSTHCILCPTNEDTFELNE